MPPVKPMLAKARHEVPTGDGLYYEPKWDGFRCIVFRDGDEVELGSRNERPLTRYFPEVVEAVKAQPAREVRRRRRDRRSPAGRPAATSRRCCSASTRPSRGCSCWPSRPRRRSSPSTCWPSATSRCSTTPFAERRARLESALAGVRPPVHLTADHPATPRRAQRWFDVFEGAGLDGVDRQARRPAVRAGQAADDEDQARRAPPTAWSPASAGTRAGPIVGSLLLGLYDDAGDLQHVGVAASFPMARRAELVEELAPYRETADGAPVADWANAQVARGRRRAPDARRGQPVEREEGPLVGPLRPSWSWRSSTTSWRASLRHTGQFLRWRPDRDARPCTYDQLDVPVRYDLAEVLAG